jgi:hypothetical protein
MSVYVGIGGVPHAEHGLLPAERTVPRADISGRGPRPRPGNQDAAARPRDSRRMLRGDRPIIPAAPPLSRLAPALTSRFMGTSGNSIRNRIGGFSRASAENGALTARDHPSCRGSAYLPCPPDNVR